MPRNTATSDHEKNASQDRHHHHVLRNRISSNCAIQGTPGRDTLTVLCIMNNTQTASAVAARLDAPVISDICHLGGRGALYLMALVQAHQSRQLVAPTLEATASLLSVLDALGVIRAEHRSTPVSNTTFPDKLPWSYTWPHVAFDDLEARLQSHLSGVGRNTIYADTWLRIWQELIPAEVTAYLHYQLRLHQFSESYLSELMPMLLPNESRYSLGNWRYACWVSVRSMASVALQHPGNAELLKFTLRSELSRRLQIALDSPGEKFCFSPSYSMPISALSSVFSRVATSLGDNFWKSPPSYDVLQSS